jgi:hypothetical protein
MLEYEFDDCDYGDESEDEKQLKSNYFYIKNQISKQKQKTMIIVDSGYGGSSFSNEF